MLHTSYSLTFEIFVGISFSSLLLFPGHGDIQKVSYTAVWGVRESCPPITEWLQIVSIFYYVTLDTGDCIVLIIILISDV